jgi:glucose-1-phosphate cytidylyltransferase
MATQMKTVILCGGKGMRLREQTNSIPKPMALIGDKSILWHIMKIYSHFGFNEFILCLGYKGEVIEEYFKDTREWNIVFEHTGEDTNTGGRIKRIEKYINEDMFFATYGDGLANIDLNKLLNFHKNHSKIATLTTVKPHSQFGMLELDGDDFILDFKEKPLLDYWINGGFFVFNKEVFDYIGMNDVLEGEVFERLVRKRELVAYKYEGFWKCMDTYKDNIELNEMWNKRDAKWAIWSYSKEV